MQVTSFHTIINIELSPIKALTLDSGRLFWTRDIIISHRDIDDKCSSTTVGLYSYEGPHALEPVAPF